MHGQNLMHTDWSTKTTEQQQQHTSTAMTKKRWQRKNWNLMIVKHLLIIKQWRCGCILLIQFREPCAFFALRTVYKREKLIIIDTNVSALNKVVYFRILCMPQCRCCLLIYIYIFFPSHLVECIGSVCRFSPFPLISSISVVTTWAFYVDFWFDDFLIRAWKFSVFTIFIHSVTQLKIIRFVLNLHPVSDIYLL